MKNGKENNGKMALCLSIIVGIFLTVAHKNGHCKFKSNLIFLQIAQHGKIMKRQNSKTRHSNQDVSIQLYLFILYETH